MKHLLFIKAGTSKALAYIEKNAFLPSEVINLKLELDNS